eukprot:CAMPEP_0194208120 /NCGR_PEP_ID=MMETSP0156-20130528/6660_1 /TAXON_ID=33649 /ORGANISM="Thalassionema nitzschioides, Strain L26-B" /LENGTH=446 /DNA_ID=CAMNT_0038935017 /DNA_START=30 /DNA_END=1370 /DNA_ORIENTATION=-
MAPNYGGEETSLLGHSKDEQEVVRYSASGIELVQSYALFPSKYEGPHHQYERSLKRRMFLILTEPFTSLTSLVFFLILIITIFASNAFMMMQTMDYWQFTPTDCVSCGGPTEYLFEDDAPMKETTLEIAEAVDVECICAPEPLTFLNVWTTYLIYFFTVEWILRVLCFEPAAAKRRSGYPFFKQWMRFVMDSTTVLDALAIFPYYMESLDSTNGLVSLRLLRLFRVFSLLRLGKYNTTFITLKRVLTKSVPYFKLLIIVLIFGAAFFGSMIYWLEKGRWTFNEEAGAFMYMRPTVSGVGEEPSPFGSIPSSFWWFMVTATTVGYGDVYPTSTGGKFVAIMAMLTGVLVIAFPVSVFSDLWSRELKRAGTLVDDDDDDDDDEKEDDHMENRSNNDELQAIYDCMNLIEESQEEIKNHTEIIDENQHVIRSLLAKYQRRDNNNISSYT